MDLKSSMFNYQFEKDDNIFLYNSYTGMIAKSPRVELIRNILNNPSEFQGTDSKLPEEMIKDGFLVEKNLDENSLADLNHLDLISNHTLSLTLIPTQQCNFRCKYCYEIFRDITMTEDIQKNLLTYLKKNIKNYAGLEIDWFGGEPLLVPDIVNELSQKMIKLCQDRYIPYVARMTTNGYNLTLETFRQMLKNRIVGFQITLDGPRDLHNRTRPLANKEPSFDVIIKNLRDIRDNIKSSVFTIIVRANVTIELADEIDGYLEFLSGEFGSDKRFTFLFRPAGDWGGKRVHNIEGSLLASFTNVFKKLINSKYQLNYRIYHGLLLNAMCEAAKRNNFIIGADAKVYKCTMMFEKDENLIGNINDKGEMILDKVKLSKWVFKFNKLKKMCYECSFRPRCNYSSCPAKGIILPDERECGYENAYVEDVLQLITNKGTIDMGNYIKYYT